MNTVTQEQVNENMQDIIVKTEIEFDKPVTYVTIKMKNGFTVRESTTCVDPKNYNEEVGKKICLKKIEDKIWMLLGYSLQDKIFSQNNNSSIIQKLLLEKSNLDLKISKLAFFLSGDKYNELTEFNQNLLLDQLGYMKKYSCILGKRINTLVKE